MMDEKTRALLGDREAQEAITARGELLPCPHCGGRPVIVIGTLRNAGKYSVTCGMCFSATGWNTLEADAIKIWNHRAPLLTPTQMAMLGIAREPRKFEEGVK